MSRRVRHPVQHPPTELPGLHLETQPHAAGGRARATGMGLHLLGEDQEDMARLFGEETGDLVDKFAAVDWRLGSTGAPLLVESAVCLEGQTLGHSRSAITRASCCAAVCSVAGGHAGLLTYRDAPPLEPGHPASSIRRLGDRRFPDPSRQLGSRSIRRGLQAMWLTCPRRRRRRAGSG